MYLEAFFTKLDSPRLCHVIIIYLILEIETPKPSRKPKEGSVKIHCCPEKVFFLTYRQTEVSEKKIL